MRQWRQSLTHRVRQLGSRPKTAPKRARLPVISARSRPTDIIRLSARRIARRRKPLQTRVGAGVNFLFVGFGTFLAGVGAVVAVYFSAQQARIAAEQVKANQVEIEHQREFIDDEFARHVTVSPSEDGADEW